jgi:hypothetical protein
MKAFLGIHHALFLADGSSDKAGLLSCNNLCDCDIILRAL